MQDHELGDVGKETTTYTLLITLTLFLTVIINQRLKTRYPRASFTFCKKKVYTVAQN